MSNFELPANLVEAAEQDVDGSHWGWLAGLPSIVDDLVQRWALVQVEGPFQPGGVASWVAPVRTASGQLLALKLGWPHDEALHEAEGLQAWAGRGAVRLIDAVVVDGTNAMLLELCEPGTALSQGLSPPQQDAVVAGLLRRLWIEPPPAHPFRPLESMCRRWADEFDQRCAAAAPGQFPDLGLARAGSQLLRSLPTTAQRCVLLGTDVHPDNVLAAQREPWLVIDPKPYVGDPTYDPLQHLLNFPERLAADAAGFAQRMADLCGLDGDRLRLWLFARCVLESLDQPQLRQAVLELAP